MLPDVTRASPEWRSGPWLCSATVDIGGSPEEIRAQATRVRRWAAELDGTRDDVRRGYGVRWVGLASERYRDRLHEHARAVDERRQELLGLAASLDALADELEERQAAIRRAAEAVQDAVDGARRTVGRLWDTAVDVLSDGERAAKRAAERVLDTVGDAVPPPGSPIWLDLAKKVAR